MVYDWSGEDVRRQRRLAILGRAAMVTLMGAGLGTVAVLFLA